MVIVGTEWGIQTPDPTGPLRSYELGDGYFLRFANADLGLQTFSQGFSLGFWVRVLAVKGFLVSRFEAADVGFLLWLCEC